MVQQNIHSLPVQSAEEILVAQSLVGDEEAFAVLVHRYEPRLLGYIRHLLGRSGDEDQAYDVLQHVLLQLYRSLPILSARSSLRPWLFRVAHNRCMDELRRKRRHVLFSELEDATTEEDASLLALIHDPHPTPEEVVERQEMQQEFMHAVDTLPSKYRSVVLLRCLDGLNFREIGQRLNMPDTTVKTYFHRARPLLRAALTHS